MKAVGDALDLGFPVKVVRGAGAAVEAVRFGDLLTGPVVVSVYLRNNTGTCDRQNDALVAAAEAIAARGFALIAVSRDTAGSHAKYAVRKAVGYPLVSDPEDRFATAADAVVDKVLYGRAYRGPLRSAWVLDRPGRVLAVIARVDAARHGEQVLAAIDAL